MKRIFILSIFAVLMSNSVVYANSEDKPPSYEDMYTEWGYTTIDEALTRFENFSNKELKLPLRVPPIAFTHYFGKFNDLEGDVNDSFSAQFVNDKHPENHYKIDVKAAKNGIELNERQVIDTYKLKDGTTSSYISLSQHQIGFYALEFTRNDWQYILSIDERIADTVTPEVLVEIANSLETES